MYYYSLFSISFLVLAVGVVLLLLRKRLHTGRLGFILTAIGGVVSLVMLCFALTYPTADQLESQERLLFSTGSNGINSIVIEPRRREGDISSRLTLVQSAITVTDKKQIQRILAALHQAKLFVPNHPGMKWGCLLTIKAQDKAVTLDIDDTDSQGNGVLLYLWSNRDQGWSVANYRCDPLGPVLEELARKIGNKDKKD
jgi:hypothetical protein